MAQVEKDWYRYRDLEARGYGDRVTIYRAVKAGKFPPPFDDGRGRPAWLRQVIEDFNTSRPRYQSELV